MQCFIIRFQGEEICGPKGWDCIEESGGKNFSCGVTCQGIYADVQQLEEKEEDKEKISRLVKQYNEFKKENLPNFLFNHEQGKAKYSKY